MIRYGPDPQEEGGTGERVRLHGGERPRRYLPPLVETHPNAVAALCCWGDRSGSRQLFWTRLRRCCNQSGWVDQVEKIERIRQRDHSWRYDIYCNAEVAQHLLEYMHRHGWRWGWNVRTHRAGRHRRRIAPVQPPPVEEQEEDMERPRVMLKVGTYNINGARGKKRELQRLLEKEKLTVLAVQETLLRDTDWILHIPGYHCFQICGTHAASERGLGLFLQNGYNGYVVGDTSPWHVLIRLSGKGITQPLIMGCVYIPCGEWSQQAREVVEEQIRRVAAQFPRDPIHVMGDFNMTPIQVDTWLERWTIPFQRMRLAGQQRTRRAMVGRQIDGMICKRLIGQPICHTGHVERQWDMSDHFLVTWRMMVETRRDPGPNVGDEIPVAGMVPLPKIDVARMLKVEPAEMTARFVEAAQWQGLIIETEEEFVDDQISMDAAAQKWCDTVREVAQEMDGVVPPTAPKRRQLMRSLQRCIDRRCKAYVLALQEGLDAEELQQRWNRYRLLKRLCRKKIHREQRVQWHKTIQSAATQLLDAPKKFWRWASSHAGWRRKNSETGAQPICHPHTGILLTDAGQILDAWRIHYGVLATDVTGHSRDPEHWIHRFPHIEQVIENPAELDEPFEVEDVITALRMMKRHKAAGTDGLPAEVLKLAIPPERRVDPDEIPEPEEPSPMLLALHQLLQRQWQGAIIPEIWQSSVVVSIPKKGDLSKMDNYRGISLMGTTLKVLVTMVRQRLTRICEESELFTPAQAGFRQLEECVVQAACLYEICKRRRIQGLETVLVFIDIKKAYDTVPHEALFRKLDAYGVRGRMLRYLRALYAESTIRVRAGDPSAFRVSDPAYLRRGLRQGCPLSPILFNIFINDILHGLDEWGAPVPCLPVDKKVTGLLFADDLVLTAPNVESAEAMLHGLTQWLLVNEMAAGISKCGIMVVGGTNEILEREPERWKLSGQTIPIVTEYRYLGVIIRQQIDVTEMMVERLESGRRLVAMTSPFLRCSSIPLIMRTLVLKAVVVPILLFGAELYGMCREVTKKVQIFLNQALRAMASVPNRSSVSNVALWREFRVPPICASAAARRARAWRKCIGSRTWIGLMAQYPMRSLKWTWVTGSTRWVKRYVVPLGAFLPQPQEWQELEPKALAKYVTAAVWAREERVHRSHTGQWYLEYVMQKQPVYRVGGTHHPAVALGLNAIVKCRIGGFWTAKRLARREVVSARYLRECPCCGRAEAEDLYHLLWTCPRWAGPRAEWISVAEEWDVMRDALAEPRDRDAVVALLLGGERAGRPLPGWKIPVNNREEDVLRESDSDGEEGSEDNEDESDSDSEHESDDGIFELGVAAHNRELSFCMRLARFLTEVLRVRAPIIKAIR